MLSCLQTNLEAPQGIVLDVQGSKWDIHGLASSSLLVGRLIFKSCRCLRSSLPIGVLDHDLAQCYDRHDHDIAQESLS